MLPSESHGTLRLGRTVEVLAALGSLSSRRFAETTLITHLASSSSASPRLVLIDAYNGYTLDAIANALAAYMHEPLASLAVAEAMSLFRLVKVRSIWEVLKYLENITQTCVIIIDSLFHIVSPYQSYSTKPAGAPQLAAPLIAQLSILIRYLNCTFDCAVVLVNAVLVPPQNARAGTDASLNRRVFGDAHMDCVDESILCSEDPGDPTSIMTGIVLYALVVLSHAYSLCRAHHQLTENAVHFMKHF